MADKIAVTRDSLVMQYPASWWRDTWREALVCGNGHTGASFYGGTKVQTIMITDGDLWYGGKEAKTPDVHDHLRIMREKMDRGEYKEASWELVNALKDKEYDTEMERALPLADIKIELSPKEMFQEYVRALNMRTGEASCQWMDQGVLYRCDGFVSRADDIILYRIRTSKPVINGNFRVDMHTLDGTPLPDDCKEIYDSRMIKVENDWMEYRAVNTDHLPFGIVVRLESDGKQKEEYNRIFVEDASEVVIKIKTFIKDRDGRRQQKAKETLASCRQTYDELFSRHVPRHEALYLSAQLEFDGYEGRKNEPMIYEAFQSKQCPEMMEKMWKFGRYLFISGTAEDANPFPFYGIWGGALPLMWCHNMSNENTQMVYWHSFTGNLVDFHRGLFQYYNSRMETYRKNAKDLFGCRGIYMTAGTTPNVSTPSQIVPVIINWIGAAGWMAQHYCNYMAYCPEEEEYIKTQILPYLEETAAFYEDFIQYKEDGSIKVYPSVSPENTPQNFMPPLSEMIAHPMPTTVNSTVDLAIIKEFFTNMIAIGKKYGIYREKYDLWETIIRSIPPYKTNEYGAIREWQEEAFEDRYDHRHLSHIYPLFPGTEVNSVDQPEEMEKFKRAVDLRKIDAQTGWSMAHMAAVYARLDEGEKAAQCLDNLAKSCLLSNFFTLHNDWRGLGSTMNMDPAPVQLDAAVGYVNAIQEMILFASKDLLKLLPALPERLEGGSVKNFRYPDGILSMRWNQKENNLHVEMKAIRPHTIRVQLPDGMGGMVWTGIQPSPTEKSNVVELTFEKAGETAIGETK